MLFTMMNSLAITLSSYGKNTQSTEWPFETFPNFEKVVSNYRHVSQSRLIATVPFVENDQKAQWEEYSTAEQGWIKESYQTIGLDIEPLPIPSTIYNIQDQHATEALQGPFKPLWQTSPPPKSAGVVNYNLMSNSMFADAFDISVQSQEALLTQITDISILLDDEPNAQESLLVQPIFVDMNNRRSLMVGSIVASVSWNIFFSDLVRPENTGMVCVLKNSCGDSLTWELKGGLATFLGAGDFHDSDFDEYVYVSKLTPFLTTDPTTPGFCEYEIFVYPSSVIESDYISNAPAIYTSVIVLVFVILGAGFMVYDHLVQKRQREAMNNAARSDAIVQSLFPADIRERLFKGDETDDKKGKSMEKDSKNELLQSVPEGQKFRLKNFLDEADEEGNANNKDINRTGAIKESKPIADLFPNTTVMFADIAGFTAWSSVREPSQVFTLLETVYKSFDKTAKKRKVFKVETVG